jgi:hypothetical protein
MSQMSQSRYSDRAPMTTGLSSKEDNFGAGRHFAFVPMSDIANCSIMKEAASVGGLATGPQVCCKKRIES